MGQEGNKQAVGCTHGWTEAVGMTATAPACGPDRRDDNGTDDAAQYYGFSHVDTPGLQASSTMLSTS